MQGQGFDIGIAGCGVAGLAAALLLHRSGHSVTLYERFEEPRPLGSGLMIQPTGLAVLAELGLAADTVASGAAIGRLFGRNALGDMVLDARYSDLAQQGVFGIGIHRGALFSLLYNAVLRAGIAVRTGAEAVATELLPRGRAIRLAGGGPVTRHDLVVDALGLHSPIADPCGKWLDYGALWTSLHWPEGAPFDASTLEQRYRAARQMAGVLPLGTPPGAECRQLAFFWSLRADALAGWQDRGLSTWKQDVLCLWPECDVLLAQIHDPAQLTFARYAHRTLANPVGDRIIHLGDAWHSASPQLGQGANMALLDAWALARALAGPGSLQEKLARALSFRRGHIHLYQRLTALFTPVYQSDRALPAVMRDLFLAPLSRVGPGGRVQAILVSGLAGSPLAKLGLRMPDYGALRAAP